MSRWGGRLAALLVGAPLALAFPRPGWWWLALVGLAPVLLLALTAPDGREAAVRAWLGGTGFFLAVNAFLFPTVGVFMVPLAMLLAVLWAPVGWLAPSRPQGPPRPSQDRTTSPATNALGTSTSAAASRQRRNASAPTATTSGMASTPRYWKASMGWYSPSGSPLTAWKAARSMGPTRPSAAITAHTANTARLATTTTTSRRTRLTAPHPPRLCAPRRDRHASGDHCRTRRRRVVGRASRRTHDQ